LIIPITIVLAVILLGYFLKKVYNVVNFIGDHHHQYSKKQKIPYNNNPDSINAYRLDYCYNNPMG
ncbi:MAG TPA: hypothetical protein PLH80_11420, partial [Spirochaetota bacterium]|nr:hypothetical protein [Spirochaetota bacterium]HQK08174.1 hypothetical protein [Spirochaetota bacterium]